MSPTIYKNISYFIILALFLLPIQSALGAVAMHLHNDLHYDVTNAVITSFTHHKNDISHDDSNEPHKTYEGLHAEKHCDNQNDTCHSCSSCAHCISIVYTNRSLTKKFTHKYLALKPSAFQSANSLVNLRPPRSHFS